MTFHPYVQLQVGWGEDAVVLSPIPPKYIQSYTYTSSILRPATVDFTLTDPNITEIEDVLLSSDRDSQPIYSRFGYLDDTNQVTGKWIQTRLLNYIPRLSNRGMEITASSIVFVNEDANIIISPKTYSGKISDIVSSIAQELGLEEDIEETADDGYDGDQEKQWRTECRSLTQFVKDKLIPNAKSKNGSSNYEFYISRSRSAKRSTLHFHTRDYEDCKDRAETKEYTYYLGKQDKVISFSPNYNSSALGKIGAGGLVMRYYDHLTGQYVSQNYNLETNKEQEMIGTGDKVVTPSLTTDVSDTSKSGGMIHVNAANKESAETKAKMVLSLLQGYSFTANLELVGLPDTVDIEANSLVDIKVLVQNYKDKSGQEYKTHWSSGLYIVSEVAHEISSSYRVTCQLRRGISQEGIEKSTNPKGVSQ